MLTENREFNEIYEQYKKSHSKSGIHLFRQL